MADTPPDRAPHPATRRALTHALEAFRYTVAAERNRITYAAAVRRKIAAHHRKKAAQALAELCGEA